MPEFSVPDTSAGAIEPLKADAADAAARFARANRSVLEIMFGVQKMLFDEAVFTSKEIVDRGRTETHLFSEYVSKMAGSHSVKDLKTMLEECSRHQIDFMRRDCERLFKHGERVIETGSNLLTKWPRS